jgi:hypothetical protein
MTDQGILGFTDDTQTEGAGFVVPSSGDNVLYIGGLWVSQCQTYVANRDYGDDPEQEWEVSTGPDGSVIVDDGGVSDQDIVSSYRDTGGNDTRNFFVRQESWAWADDPDDDFIIVRYFIENEADSAQVDLYAGLFLDLDVGNSAAENSGGSDPIEDLIYMTDGSGVYAGLKRLHADQMPDVTANVTFIHNPTFIWPDGYVPDTDKLAFLQASDSAHNVEDATSLDDYSVLVSVGPFSLDPGQSNEVVFALVGGSSLSDLRANAERAQIKYIEVTQSPAGLEDHNPSFASAKLLPNMPNPFDPQTTVRFELEGRADVSLVVYDAQGRRVRTLVEGSQAEGSHSLIWDGRNERGNPVSNGIYFLRMRSGTVRDSRRMVVLRR